MAVEATQDFWAYFNWVDWTIVAILGFSMVVSILRGFLREVISLATWVAAVWISFHHTHDVSVLLEGHVQSDMMRMLISVGVLFFATLIVGVLVNVMIGGMMMRSRLSLADRFLGVVFGATRGILLVTLLTMVGGMTMLPQSDWWANATLVPYFEHSASWLATFLPEKVVHFVGNEQIINEAQVRTALAKLPQEIEGVVDGQSSASNDTVSVSQ